MGRTLGEQRCDVRRKCGHPRRSPFALPNTVLRSSVPPLAASGRLFPDAYSSWGHGLIRRHSCHAPIDRLQVQQRRVQLRLRLPLQSKYTYTIRRERVPRVQTKEPVFAHWLERDSTPARPHLFGFGFVSFRSGFVHRGVGTFGGQWRPEMQGRPLFA